MNGRRDTKDIVARFLREVWNQGDVTAAARFLAPRYRILHDPGDPWDGQELDLAAFQQRVRISRAPFPDQRFEVQELFAEGDAVMASWLWSGTPSGDLPGFPASGRRLRMSGATVYYFDGDRIRGHWQVSDRLGVLQQLRAAAAD